MRCRLSAVGVLVMGLVWCAGPAAAVTTPLGFGEAEALKTTCAKLAAGVELTIRNETAIPRDVHLVASAFTDGENEPTAIEEVCGGLAVERKSQSLQGGEVAAVTLRASRRKEGTFSGSLALFTQGGRVARREVAISEEVPAEGLEVSPLVGSQSVDREHHDLFDQGLVWVPVDVPNKDLPPVSKSSQGTEATTVGALAGPEGTVAVTYSGESKPLTDTTSLVGLDLEDARPGSYSGTVDLNPADDEKGKVDLALTVTTWWPIPAAVLLLGICLGVWLQRWAGLENQRAQLLKRVEELQSRHDEALQVLRRESGSPPDGGGHGGNGGGGPAWRGFRVGNIEKLQGELSGRVERGANKTLILLDKTVLTDLEARIGGVETQVDLLEAIPEHGRDLEEALRKLETERPPQLPKLHGSDFQQEKPSLDATARKVLVGETVDADELKARIERIDLLAEQVHSLQRLEERLGDLWRAKSELASVSEEPKKVETALIAIRHLLWRAEGKEDLDTVAKKIQDTTEQIAEAWHLLPPVSQPPQHVYGFSLSLAEEPIGTLETLVGDLKGDEALPPPPFTPAPLPAAPPPPQFSNEAVDRKVARARLSQYVVVGVTAGVALASGLAALYVGKAWGSRWDYLAALVWGLGVQAAVLAIATSIDGLAALRPLRRS